MTGWAQDAVFYHIYPLGACGAPSKNDPGLPTVPRLQHLVPWLEHAAAMGATALYLGPVFQSDAHGYDTADYFCVDRRLGTDETLAELIVAAHRLGLRVVLDAVFPHVGRGFWAFRDVQNKGPNSSYCDWFCDLDFSRRSDFGDAFAYAHWRDAPELPRLNLSHPDVCLHLLAAVDRWIDRFDIDGLRLDSVDAVAPEFLSRLRTHCTGRRSDFWLLGEAIHGDYRRWANPSMLHSVTNYEVYKGLWSSHADRNFFEIAYALQRQFGDAGLYRGMPLYNFADNHDVNRVASMVRERAQLFSLYCLLFTIPGIPALYAGSEYGLAGIRTATDDRALRPYLDLPHIEATGTDLCDAITRLIAVRRGSDALHCGRYRQLAVAAEQLAFLRQSQTEAVVVAVNGAAKTATLDLPLPGLRGTLVDRLNPPARFVVESERVRIDVPPTWARVLAVTEG